MKLLTYLAWIGTTLNTMNYSLRSKEVGGLWKMTDKLEMSFISLRLSRIMGAPIE